jgi:uncharacterized protein (UPF0332 family)
MTPDAAAYRAKAREDLSEARQIVGIGLAKVAARSAYYAAFHAAEAFIVERTGKIAKTHSGLRTELARLTRDDPHIDRATTSFLAQAYKYKEIGDYGVGPDAVITLQDAEAAIDAAEAFVAQVATALT